MSFGTSNASSGFGASGASSTSAFSSTSFGAFGSGSTFSFSFANVPQQADAFKGRAKKKDDGDDGEDGDGDGGGGEDNEKEVLVEKTCQLDEVETTTGEENEDNMFQVPFSGLMSQC